MAEQDPDNATIARALDELGDLYELDGAGGHRVAAYRRGAQVLREHAGSAAALARSGRLDTLPGIGKTLQEKVLALVTDGAIPAAVKLRAAWPAGVLEITRLPGVGPKRARALREALGVEDPASLLLAAKQDRILDVPGFGAKAQRRIREQLEALGDQAPADRERVPLHTVLPQAEALVEAIRAVPGVERAEIAGSARRWAETVKDLDVVVGSDDPAAVVAAMHDVDVVAGVGSSGENGAALRLQSGIDVDLRIVAPATFGNLLQHFTGGKAHNVAMRAWAVRRGLHVSEHGILDDEDGGTTRCATEEEVYARLGLPYAPPELREDRGEIDPDWAAPRLVTLEDLRGDLHCHTTASDGTASILEMARAAAARGHAYLAITDHSSSHGFGDAVSDEQLERQIEAVAEAQAVLDADGVDLRLLAGTEANLDRDGVPDYPDELLGRLDWVVGSVHTDMALDRATMTARLCAAAAHPRVHVIGHPSGRRLGRRAPYPFDVEALVAACAQAGTMLEINGGPERRDLTDRHARLAADAGVHLLLDSDAHRTRTLAHQEWAVRTARRAGLTPAEVGNTRELDDFLALRDAAAG